MQRDWQPQFARAAPFFFCHFDRDRAARRIEIVADVAGANAERDQTVGRQPFAVDAGEIGQVHRLGVRRAERIAISVAPADAKLVHGADLGVGVRRAARVVAPVVRRGDTSGQRLGEAEPGAPVGILGLIMRAILRGNGKVAEPGIVVAYERPADVGPVMPVRIDQAWHADHASPVDHLGAGRRYPGSDRDDRAAAHVHVAARKVAKAAIQRQHVGAPHDKLAARWQRAGRLRLRERASRQQARRSERARPRHHRAPVDLPLAHVSPLRCPGQRYPRFPFRSNPVRLSGIRPTLAHRHYKQDRS